MKKTTLIIFGIILINTLCISQSLHLNNSSAVLENGGILTLDSALKIGTSGQLINSISTNINLEDSSDYILPTQRAIRNFVKNRSYDYTICSDGCDFNDLSDAFSVIPNRSRVYISNESFYENNSFAIDSGVIVHFDNSYINLDGATATFMWGATSIGCPYFFFSATNSNIVITDYTNIDNIIIYPSDEITSGGTITISGNLNVIKNASIRATIYSYNYALPKVFKLEGLLNNITLNICGITFTHVSDINMLWITGSNNVITAIILNNTSSTGTVTGIGIDSGADYNSLFGESRLNTTHNLTDSGTGTNKIGLIAP